LRRHAYAAPQLRRTKRNCALETFGSTNYIVCSMARTYDRRNRAATTILTITHRRPTRSWRHRHALRTPLLRAGAGVVSEVLLYTTFTTKSPQNGTSLGNADMFYSPAWRHSSDSGLVGSTFSFPAPMRATPSVIFYNDTTTSSSPGNWGFYNGSIWANATGMGTLTVNNYQIAPSLDMGFSSNFNQNYLMRGGFSASAEL
jgi:hypothetical protein